MLYSTFELGGVTAVYYVNDNTYSLTLIPSGMTQQLKESKLALTEPLFQVCVNGEGNGLGYQSGTSFHNASYMQFLSFVRQYTEDCGNATAVITEFQGKNGLFCRHRLVGGRG